MILHHFRETAPHEVNSTYLKLVVQWLNHALYFNQNSSMVDSEVLRNRHFRVAKKR
jgi:hypothetical protein